jgi:site-specific recombinase XerD
MAVIAEDFFGHFDDFFNYRNDIYEISPQTLKSNRVDLDLFKNFICSQNLQTINGPAVIDFQYYLKKQRQNCGASINRKIYTLRSYGNFLKLYDLPCADALPFYDVLKIRQGYRKRPDALTPRQIKLLFKAIDIDTILGIRDYAIYALMYQLGLRVGEVYQINLENLDFENSKITVMGKGKKTRTLHINDQLILLSVEITVPFNVTCHSLRHSMASHLNDKHTDILIIQSILGHDSSRSTEPYIHPGQDRIRKALEKLPSVRLVKKLIKKGELNLRFQKPYRTEKE